MEQEGHAHICSPGHCAEHRIKKQQLAFFVFIDWGVGLVLSLHSGEDDDKEVRHEMLAGIRAPSRGLKLCG